LEGSGAFISKGVKFKEVIMGRNEELREALEDKRRAVFPLSPSEKLEGKSPVGVLVPGAENPHSIEIKREINPNTE
jgi:hypothetical protein